MSELFAPTDAFQHRHIGPSARELQSMLRTLGVASLQDLVDEAVPANIRSEASGGLAAPRSEGQLVEHLRGFADANEVYTALIGLGYYDTITPPVIQRNILENPGWYTQYTPYQAEISQGRMEALVNFQTLIADLTGLPLSNSSLLDEATAAAEAMAMARAITRGRKPAFYVAEDCHPQTIAVVQTRAEPVGIEVIVGPAAEVDPSHCFGVLLQYPTTDGRVEDYAALAEAVHAANGVVVVATDLLALTLLRPPAEFGADIAVGSAQRFGVPLGFGGPHAAFLATRSKHKRQMPGRIVGVSRDAQGEQAYRLALQTREQHIRRDRATSNICTAQVLLAIMAGMYAVYHGPEGLRRIAERVRGLTEALAAGLERLGFEVQGGARFDTLKIKVPDAAAIHSRAAARRINLRHYDAEHVGISLDERCTVGLVDGLLQIFAGPIPLHFGAESVAAEGLPDLPTVHARNGAYLTHPVFSAHRSEHQMLRYIHRLQARDLSLTTSMIPLGSCTMKLNATTEMLAVTWPEFSALHPFAPPSQTAGYRALFDELEGWLASLTGFCAVSLQPNAGSQGEYAGLLVIRAWQRSRGETGRDVCLIPTSAHGTNPASAVMAGMKVVAVRCDERGDIDIEDLRAKAEQHAERLSALMVTYPSTHGVFEEGITEVCEIVHAHGGQVYMDGANMNAMVGLCRPGDIGADVCHLNLHKTFCIPHGGGGPGMGPIAVAEHLAPFLPGHPLVEVGGEQAIGAISAAPWGSPSILPISHAYIAMMGIEGLRAATEVAILNANYMAHRLQGHYEVLFRGTKGRVAHEFVLDCRGFKAAGIEVADIAKRLMDYGFHAPTMSWPVPGTLMVEPTESEDQAELDRFCDALIAIREEIRAIEEGRSPADDNPLRNAPHTARRVSATEWGHSYSREQAAWPAAWTRSHKFWPPVSRVDDAYGDRNLFCTCPPWQDEA